MNELIFCPFCGETEILKPTLLSTTKGEPWKAIVCASCGAQGPISKDGLEANRLWQQRHLTNKSTGQAEGCGLVNNCPLNVVVCQGERCPKHTPAGD